MTHKPLNIILVGKTGCGKSSTGNFIVEKNVFESKQSLHSTTKEISDTMTSLDERTITVVDTPGLFDTKENLFLTALKIQTSLKKVEPGPHAFLIVIDGTKRYTEEEKNTQQIIELTFGETIFKHALIILTHEDQYDSSEELLRIAESVPELQTLIKLCGGRCITLNSRNKDKNYRTGKIKEIINEVNAISKNGNDCYREDIKAYTQALEELANKKIATKDLTADLLATCLANAKDEAKKLADAFFEKGKKEGKKEGKEEGRKEGREEGIKEGMGQVKQEGMALEIASGIVKGLAIGTLAGVGIIGLGAIGVGGMILTRNPETLVKVVKVGVNFVDDRRKGNNQDMN